MNKDEIQDLIFRLKKRAEIRRQITTRKSVQENQPDRIADLLEEAAKTIENLSAEVHHDEDSNSQGSSQDTPLRADLR